LFLANAVRNAGIYKKGVVEDMRVQTFVEAGRGAATGPVRGTRVMLLTDRPEGESAQRLTRYGSLVEVEDRLAQALTTVLDDPMGFDLFVMDCDAFGGIEGAERAIATLIANDARMRVMLVSREFDVPAYPLGRRTAVCLPAETSEESFRRGFVHVLRDRAAVTMM
jgi:hypothetical protein